MTYSLNHLYYLKSVQTTLKIKSQRYMKARCVYDCEKTGGRCLPHTAGL